MFMAVRERDLTANEELLMLKSFLSWWVGLELGLVYCDCYCFSDIARRIICSEGKGGLRVPSHKEKVRTMTSTRGNLRAA